MTYSPRTQWAILGLVLLTGITTAWATSNMDSASNYDDGWTTGSNGGGGFDAWTLEAYDGDGGWAGGGIWDSAAADLNLGTAFGFAACGTDAYFTAARNFSTPMTDGDVFKFDFGLNYDSGDSGNKGFLLLATDNREIIQVNMADSEIITVNGTTALTNYGTDTMHWTITQLSDTRLLVYATGRTGSETYVGTIETTQSSTLGGIKFYASANTDDDDSEYRQTYFDNLILTQEAAGTEAYSYSIENNHAIIQSADTSISGYVLIPSTLGGYPVGAIGRAAFLNCVGITGIAFPDNTSITNIGSHAFQGCTGLLHAALPAGLTDLEAGLFYGCSNLVSVTLPDSLLTIGAAAFAQCESLQSINLPVDLQTIGESAFLNARHLAAIQFPDNCRIAEEQVCYEGRSLASITLSSQLQDIQNRAFYNCIGLTRVDMDAPSVILGDQAFAGCAALEKVVFHNGLAALGANVFSQCTTLEGIYTAGDAPDVETDSLKGLDESAVVYYLPGTSGWNATLNNLATDEWLPLIQNLREENATLLFDVEWVRQRRLTAQYCTALDAAPPIWTDVSTTTLSATGSGTLQDPDATTRAIAFYHIIEK